MNNYPPPQGPYYQPDAYPPNQSPPGSIPYAQPGAYAYPPQQQPEWAPYPQQGPYLPNQQQPGMMPYVQPGQYPPYPPQSPYRVGRPRNVRARNAMISGFFSLGLGLLTLFTLVGFAGIITGIFAIVRGVSGLRLANQLPNNAGRGQAITGIVLGCVGLFLVIVSLLIQAAIHTSLGS